MSNFKIGCEQIIARLKESTDCARKCVIGMQEFQRDIEILKKMHPDIHGDNKGIEMFMDLDTCVIRIFSWIEMMCIVEQHFTVLAQSTADSRQSMDLSAMFSEINHMVGTIHDIKPCNDRFEWETIGNFTGSITAFITDVRKKLVNIAIMTDFSGDGGEPIGIPCIDKSPVKNSDIYRQHLSGIIEMVSHNMGNVMTCMYAVKKCVKKCQMYVIGTQHLTTLVHRSAQDAYRDAQGL